METVLDPWGKSITSYQLTIPATEEVKKIMTHPVTLQIKQEIKQEQEDIEKDIVSIQEELDKEEPIKKLSRTNRRCECGLIMTSSNMAKHLRTTTHR